MLHGLWSPGSGLLLWYPPDQGGGHRTAPGSGDATVPGLLGDVIRTAKFRHRAQVLLAEAGGVRSERVPAHALAPDAAAAALRQRLPTTAVAADLRFLAHVANGVERWVRAGRVVPELRRDDGQWWARWRLVGGAGQRAWLAELASVMPAALRVAGEPAAVLDDMVTELTDPIARELIQTRPSPHPLAQGLTADVPVDGGSHQAAQMLERWRSSLAVDETELVLRLLEPDTDDSDEVALWRLEVCLRMDGQAPSSVPLHGDPQLVRTAVERLGEAQRVYPRLRDLPGDPRSMDLLLPTEVVIDLVAHGAQALQAAGIRLLLPRAWAVSAPTMRLRVDSAVPAAESTVGLPGLVSYRWELALGDTVLTRDEMQRLVRAKSDLVQLRGEWVQADHKVLAAAAEYVAMHAEGTEVSLADMIGEIAATRVDQVPVTEVTATGWAAELFDPAAADEPVPAPIGLKAQLRPYQGRGLSWLATMSRMGLGAILADDMGLGKTIQVLAMLLHEREARPSPVGGEPGPTLLVCPMSVVGNWQREAERFAPDLRVLVHHGPARAKGDELAAAIADADLVVTTYALMTRDIADLAAREWERVVLDEAQHIKNSGTRQARAARALPARHRLALTGTPVENRLEELRSILDFAMPKLLGSAQAFRARFAVPIERERDENAITRLRAVTSPFVLRRVKTDPTVIADLPDKLEMTVRANLTVEQAALYQAVVDDMLNKLRDAKGMARKGAVLGALTRLKQVCNHPAHFLGDGSAVLRRGGHRSGKLALVEDVLDAVLADDEKALMFTQFREFGELIAPYLADRFGTRIPFLHGGVSKQRRDTMVAEFQQSDGPPLMLLSLKAGGTGLNLTAANHVVHLDRWWNPAVENQATDRAYRIGQQRAVQVRKLVCVDTIEERIDEMISGKRQLADLAVGSGENWITELSTDELRDLFTLGAEAVGE
ncbi:DEAD/DEAH box helicase [Nocardia cyriacigeorgica]|uniref:DEAD/DEAH box helicase n=1 Tax=Nocardia cyriacigeorgica TaxID=135487 RepID=A0A6P1DA59_9NOCA|nr:DEAD/DEAH box helicase [Nocardia cyriacigeorgica]NEW41791.1 DEAD/DEAH box helicase [Nocardia cyriacigeorgica]NEW47595.1 DEAD/DEAH box helicase [Nocardia cyriacigeorgica]